MYQSGRVGDEAKVGEAKSGRVGITVNGQKSSGLQWDLNPWPLR